MEDEEFGRQIIMKDGKAMTVEEVLAEIRKKAKDKIEKEFAEG